MSKLVRRHASVLQHVIHVFEPSDQLVAFEMKAQLSVTVKADEDKVHGHGDVQRLDRVQTKVVCDRACVRGAEVCVRGGGMGTR